MCNLWSAPFVCNQSAHTIRSGSEWLWKKLTTDLLTSRRFQRLSRHSCTDLNCYLLRTAQENRQLGKLLWVTYLTDAAKHEINIHFYCKYHSVSRIPTLLVHARTALNSSWQSVPVVHSPCYISYPLCNNHSLHPPIWKSSQCMWHLSKRREKHKEHYTRRQEQSRSAPDRSEWHRSDNYSTSWHNFYGTPNNCHTIVDQTFWDNPYWSISQDMDIQIKTRPNNPKLWQYSYIMLPKIK